MGYGGGAADKKGRKEREGEVHVTTHVSYVEFGVYV